MSDDPNDDMNKSIILKEGSTETTITLADLAGISLDDVAEKRGESFPKGTFAWEVDAENPPKLVVVGEGDKAKGAARYAFKCIDVIALNDTEYTGNQNDLIGKTHHETFFLTNADSLGYLKAFAKDIGTPYAPALKDLLANGAGVRFQAPIGKRKDKDDTDKVYTNIVRNKIKPLASAAGSDVAKAVA